MKSYIIILYSIAIVVLIFLSFFFSSSDMAYGSVDIIKFERELDTNKKKSFLRAYKLSKDYDKTISTILLLNDTVNAGLDSVSTLLGVNLAIQLIGADPSGQVAENWGFIASMICLVVKIIFGEIIAKSLGKIYNFKFTKLYANIINVCNYIFIPITYIVTLFAKIVTFPVTKFVKDGEILDDDLHEMIDDIEEHGQVDEEKADLLHDTITYTTTEAYEIMTPRVDLYAFDINDDIEEIINNPKTYRYSRVPVYEDTIDNIIGYVNTRKLMQLKLSKKEIDIRSILMEPLKFPRSIEINEILKIFKKEKQHFALIIDEYGGIEGIVTMEDILEEIVGDIWDENDDPDATISETNNENTYFIDGKLNLEDFCELFELDYDDINTEYVSIGGFIIELLGDKFAKVGDVIQYKNVQMTIISLDKNNTIEKIKATKLDIDEDEKDKL